MKTRWGCRGSCWSQGKVDWPAASHVLIKRLTARTMLMFRNDLVSTWGQLSRDLFSPSPWKYIDETTSALFPSPASTFLSFVTPGHAKVMFLRTINFHRNSLPSPPPPPQPSTFRERITPIFRWCKNTAFSLSVALQHSYRNSFRWTNGILLLNGKGISRVPPFPFSSNDDTMIEEIKRRRLLKFRLKQPPPERRCLRASTSYRVNPSRTR